MSNILKEALSLAVQQDPDPRDGPLRGTGEIQEKTMLSPILSETELASQKNTPPEAVAKSDALRPLLAA